MNVRTRGVRNLVFLLVMGLAAFAQSRGVLASGNPFATAAGYWATYYPCYTDGDAWYIYWDQHLHCYFDDEAEWPEDEVTLGLAMGNDLYADCVSTCGDGSDYRDAIGDYVGVDPDEWCLMTWEIYGSGVGEGEQESYASCACQFYSFCETR